MTCPLSPRGKGGTVWVRWHASYHACAGCISTCFIQEMQNPPGRCIVCVVHRLVHQELPRIAASPFLRPKAAFRMLFLLEEGVRVLRTRRFEVRCPKPRWHLCAWQQPVHTQHHGKKY